MTTTTAPAAPAYRFLGVTDECVECRRCGRRELKSTVVLAVLDADGNTEAVTYYGSTCAAHALSIHATGRDILTLARNATVRTLRAAHDAHAAWATWGHGRYATVDAAGELVWIRDAVRANAAAGVESAVKHVEHIERCSRAVRDAAAIGYPSASAVEAELRRGGWL